MAQAIRLTGFDDLTRKLDQLGDEKFAKKAQRRALMKASTPMQKAIRANTPTTDKPHLVQGQLAHKRLKKSIGRRYKYYRGSKLGMVIIGPRLGKWKGFHGHLVESGTGGRSTKQGADRGSMPAKPFMGPVVRRMASGTLRAIRVLLWSEILTKAKTA